MNFKENVKFVCPVNLEATNFANEWNYWLEAFKNYILPCDFGEAVEDNFSCSS